MKVNKIIREEVRNTQQSLAKRLGNFRYFLIYELGMKDIIDNALSGVKEINDLNDEYQKPMEILSKTGKYPDIKYIDGRYVHNRLLKSGIVRDENGEYDYVNKLNTNYSDLGELLESLFIKGGQSDKLIQMDDNELKSYLLSIKSKLQALVSKYFEVDELRQFVRNTKYLTKIGDEAEEKACEVLEKVGMKKLYQGGNGDFIDMIFGIDLIMEYKGRVITCQVKSREGYLEKARVDNRYKRIDYFITPTNNGIVIYNRKGDNYRIDNNGEIIR